MASATAVKNKQTAAVRLHCGLIGSLHSWKEIDWDQVDDLLTAGCKGTEVAAFLGIHPDTFYGRVESKYGLGFSAYLQQKRSKGDALIRAQQFAKSIGLTKKGDNMMLIWLGKNRLEQNDNDQKFDGAITINTIDYSKADDAK